MSGSDKLLKERYQILRELGSGAFGKTFLVEDTHSPSKRRHVLKQLKPIADVTQYQLIRERFEREAAVLEKLGEESGGRIPKLHAYFEDAGLFYLVQEWIEGRTLTQAVLESGPLTEVAAWGVLGSLLETLDYLHSQRIIHRDIKPDNIMIRQRDGKPVLVDFGIVKEVVRGDGLGNPTSSIAAGTPEFMPLEQAAGKPVFASDIYSLGMTMICVLTGKNPSTMTDPLTADVEWYQHTQNIGNDLAKILDRAIESHFRDRYKTAKEMLEAVRTVVNSSGTTIVRPKPVSSSLPSTIAVPPSPARIIEPPLPPTVITPVLRTFVNSIGMEFVEIPSGNFQMGSESGYNSEKPVHKVFIRYPLYIGKYPVTQFQWKSLMRNNPSTFIGDNLPVENISWLDVIEFIERLNINENTKKYRLPTESEWEYACRAGTKSDYAGDINKMGWFDENSGGRTHPVGQKQANAWGLFDMHGNVWEWCLDAWHNSYDGAPTDGSAWEQGGMHDYRVLRGGSWSGLAVNCRSAVRYWLSPDSRFHYFGFRVVAEK